MTPDTVTIPRVLFEEMLSLLKSYANTPLTQPNSQRLGTLQSTEAQFNCEDVGANPTRGNNFSLRVVTGFE